MDLLGIPGAVVVQGGAVSVLLVVVIAIITGRLVPRRTLNDVRADRDARLAEERARGDEWRAAALAEGARNDIQTKQIQELLEVGRTTNALMEGMRQAAQEKRR